MKTTRCGVWNPNRGLREQAKFLTNSEQPLGHMRWLIQYYIAVVVELGFQEEEFGQNMIFMPEQVAK